MANNKKCKPEPFLYDAEAAKGKFKKFTDSVAERADVHFRKSYPHLVEWELQRLRKLEPIAERHKSSQKDKSKKDRNRDLFASLLKRTYESLTASGKVPKLHAIINALGKHDLNNILVANPESRGQYGEPPDSKRTYSDTQKRLVYWRASDQSDELKFIEYAKISARISRLKQKKVR